MSAKPDSVAGDMLNIEIDGKPFQATEQFTFSKEVKPKLVALTLTGPGSGGETIALGNW